MLDISHPDFKRYEKEFKQIKENMKNDYNNIKTNYNRMDGEETFAIHKKYASQIKSLQQKYSYLFIKEK